MSDFTVRNVPKNAEETMKRWPRIVAHIICESLGYAVPSLAARILLDAILGQENWCEWVDAVYGRNPALPVRAAIRRRHYHKGYMAEYQHAKALVDRANTEHREPVFASWF